ncbi:MULTISPECIES: hypothetical protein [Mycobacterium]|uniref:Uncharacterized protein n=1 Tax=Mycobacterium kiyosense TaxID=2871094 RepID=A0A9P3Q878_9MYCO|nr:MULTISPECIES: hypothetical protein [Mycobacterium]BDB40193.1 hypothetical protein IWGMT90018_06390 [Mycobacterium kiyosense]BDE12023.1 hypothetical protein MKCMC460_08830 [Mycobacterium sp. 20KCMC460]GLB84264.1 hypothetical protein SRL2020028_35200 [Mycobacterium kiyosense]GLB91684.1 hypothetical protein SRL2020130_45010 [Mycobacterium kiyosense]GLB97671.1 hypothetical protein SRL2020226_44470 [Mycobacterium kiyosense]
MACCVIAALLLAIAHRLTPWRRRKPDVAGFAPPATRPAPGEGLVSCGMPQHQPSVALTRHLAASAWICRFVAVGAGVYFAAVALALRSGLAHSTASVSIWAARTLGMVAVAGIAMALSTNIFRRGADRSTGREISGYAAIGLGLMLIEGTSFDMHLLSTYYVMSSSLHNAIHLAGYGLLLPGIAVALPSPQQRSEEV